MADDAGSWTPPAATGPTPPPVPPAGFGYPVAPGSADGPAHPTGPGYPIGAGYPAPMPLTGVPVAPMPGPGQGWAPPPKPGLIPLRPLTLGTILGATFTVMRRNPLPTFGLALLLTLGSGLVSIGLVAAVAWFTFSRAATVTGADQDAIYGGGVISAILAGILSFALQSLVAAIVQGTVTLEVSRGVVGERLPLRALWRRLRPSLGRLLGWIGLLSLAWIVGVALLVGLIVLAANSGQAGPGVAIAIGLLMGLALAVAAVWLGVLTIYVPAAITVERLTLRAAIVRSATLIRGSWWKSFGILVLVYVMFQVASSVVATPISFIGGIVVSLVVGDTGDPSAGLGAVIVLYAVIILVQFVVGAFGVVMLTSTTALLYTDLRMRREGLDLELIRFVEARAAGDTGVPDPWLRSAAPPGTSPGDGLGVAGPWTAPPAGPAGPWG